MEVDDEDDKITDVLRMADGGNGGDGRAIIKYGIHNYVCWKWMNCKGGWKWRQYS